MRGNADRELVGITRGEPCEHPESVWAAAQLRPDQVALLDGLPHPVTRDVDGFGPVLFCHGSPRDDDEVVLVDTRLERWAEAKGPDGLITYRRQNNARSLDGLPGLESTE